MDWKLTDPEILAICQDSDVPFMDPEHHAIAMVAARKALWWAAKEFALGTHTQRVNEAVLIAAGIEAWEEPKDGN